MDFLSILTMAMQNPQVMDMLSKGLGSIGQRLGFGRQRGGAQANPGGLVLPTIPGSRATMPRLPGAVRQGFGGGARDGFVGALAESMAARRGGELFDEPGRMIWEGR